MRSIAICLLFIICPLIAISQEMDQHLNSIREKLNTVLSAKCKADMKLDIDFIHMPEKQAEIVFEQGKELEITSTDLAFIPKRGLDFSWKELFDYDFMTIEMGFEEHLKVLKVIPLDKKSDYAIMTLRIDTIATNIRSADITSKNDGTFMLEFEYDSENPFPGKVIFQFEMERIRIPLNFMGKDAEVDRSVIKNDELKEGTVYLDFHWSDMEFTTNDISN